METLALYLIVGLPAFAFLVVTRMTPNAPRAPYTAVEEASFNTEIFSTSSGLTAFKSPSTPSTNTKAEPPAPMEVTLPRILILPVLTGLPSTIEIVKPGTSPCKERTTFGLLLFSSTSPDTLEIAPMMSRLFCTP